MKYRYTTLMINGINAHVVQVLDSDDYSRDTYERFKRKYGRSTVFCFRNNPNDVWSIMNPPELSISAQAEMTGWEDRTL